MIGPGDLVWIAKPMPCCGHRVPLTGDHFVVSEVLPCPPVQCMFCMATHEGINVACGHRLGAIPVFLLEKVPPLVEDERIEEVSHA